MRTVCVFTGTRAEYGLLQPLMNEIREDPSLGLKLLVSGMHLSPEFGLTYREILADGFKIDETVEILLSSDTATGVCKAVGLGLIGFAESLGRINPDILVVLGDRFEAQAAAQAAVFSRIPIAHIQGGEATYGLIDEPIRHSITKMSLLHFTSTEEYRRRVIQLGEHPERVFNVGALGIENIRHIRLQDRESVTGELGMTPDIPYLLVTFHPVTLERGTAAGHIKNLLAALDRFTELNVVFTRTNADTEGRIINSILEEYSNRNNSRTRLFTSLGQKRYLSVMRHAVAVVGNSSSGIIEAPSLGIPTVNIGDRQMGRVRAKSVVDCEPEREEIAAAIRHVLSPVFKESIREMVNPYEKEGTSLLIKDTVRDFDLRGGCKKEFYDVDFQIIF